MTKGLYSRAPEGHEDEMRGGDLNLRPFALAADFFAVILSAAISEAANDRQALSSLPKPLVLEYQS